MSEKYIITKEDRAVYEETLTNMLYNSKYTDVGSFYANMITRCAIEFDPDIDYTAGVKLGRRLFIIKINPKMFNKHPLNVRIGILIHEMLHIVNLHHFRIRECMDPKMANFCTDAAINQLIPTKIRSESFLMHHHLKTIFNLDKIPNERESFEHYYSLIKSQCSGESEGESEGEGQGESEKQSPGKTKAKSKDYDEIHESHKEWGDSDIEESEGAEIVKELLENARDDTMRNNGKMPAEYDKWIEIISNVNRVNWKNILRRLLCNKRADRRPTIKRRNKRYIDRIDVPGRKSDIISNLVVIADTSGSVSDDELSDALSEILNITKCTSSDLFLIQVDVEASEPQIIKRNQTSFNRQRGGGTFLSAALEKLQEKRLKYGGIVVITDGDLSQDDITNFTECGKKIIWLITKNGTERQSMISENMEVHKLS